MSQDVLISIRPKWCWLIASGKKTVEVRKTAPKIKTPFKCYIYCTNGGRPLVYGDKACASGWHECYTQTYGRSRAEADRIWGVLNGKVIGEFMCDGIAEIKYEQYDAVDDAPDDGFYQWWDAPGDWPLQINSGSCLTNDEWQTYLGKKGGYAWHISSPKIYDEPKTLDEFCLYYTSTVIEHGLPMPTHEIKRPPQSWCYVRCAP